MMKFIGYRPDDVKAKYDRSSMRIMIANAAPWSFALKQQYVRDFPPESLFEVYGSTELGVNTILRPEDQMRKPGSCGKESPMVEIRLYDDAGNIVTDAGPEATGELYVRSRAVFADYYKQHDKFDEDHRDGFQTVGDIAYRDDEGILYICDRKKDMIISGGMNIYPAEIEAALEAHPDIYEAAVFGIPSDDWGELVHAVVVKRPGSDLDEAGVTAARPLLGRPRNERLSARPSAATVARNSTRHPTAYGGNWWLRVPLGRAWWYEERIHLCTPPHSRRRQSRTGRRRFAALWGWPLHR